MAGDARQSEEVLRHDRHRKVPRARRGAGVAGVLRAVVADFEPCGGECCEPPFESGLDVVRRGVHRLPERDGSMTWRARNSACASANVKKRPMPPHTLKLTQVSVEKWNAMYQLANAIATKNATQLHVSRVHTAAG